MLRIVLFMLVSISVANGEYQPTWESLDKRPLPVWYEDAKIGIFLHWGVYSVPSFGSEWFWSNWKGGKEKYVTFMKKNYPPGFSYQDFAKDFTAEFFDPQQWAELLQASGAKYVVLTSKHHEGFTMWPSKYSFSWNAKDVGPHRDLVGELATAIRNKTDLKFGLYHSLYEWFNPLWLQDFTNHFTTTDFVTKKIWPELIELVEQYHPEIIWSDGEWDAPDWYWNSTLFLAWLYNDSPVAKTVVSNDRWGHDILCKHGDFYTCTDRFNPGILQSHKWENCFTIDRKSWGFRREANIADFMTHADIIKEVMSTVSCGGNVLINAGPTKEGTIAPIFEERLRSLGSWLRINGEAIYKSRPWTYQNETVQTGVWYTRRDTFVYASVLDWPEDNLLTLNRLEIGDNNKIYILGHAGYLKTYMKSKRVTIMLPDISRVNVPLPWVLKFTNITN